MNPATDLCAVSDVLSFIGQSSSTAAQSELQQCVSAASLYILRACAVDNFNAASYTQTFNGNNSFRLFLRNYPVTGVTSLVVNGTSIAQSSAWNAAGYIFDDTSLQLRPGTITFPNVQSGIFPWGIGNVVVSYTAGYESLPYDLVQAAVEIAANTYVKGQFPMKASLSSGVAGASGTTRFGLEVPLTAQQTIRNYARTWGTAS